MVRPFAILLCLAVWLQAPAVKAEDVAPQSVRFAGPQALTLYGFLYAPATPGRHPAVVALHGCAGLTDADGKPSARHDDWGRRLAAQGFVVLFPDSFASRGLGPQCKVAEREVKPARERAADAAAALAFLAARPDVDPAAISLLGWSNGGTSVLRTVEPKKAPDGPDFVRAVAFYPGCRAAAESGRWSTRMPLLILIGQADDWTPAAPCLDLAAEARAAGEPVDIVTYPGAYHDFDHPDLPVHTVSGLAFTGTGTGVAHTGTNLPARADAIRRVAAYLSH